MSDTDVVFDEVALSAQLTQCSFSGLPRVGLPFPNHPDPRSVRRPDTSYLTVPVI